LAFIKNFQEAVQKDIENEVEYGKVGEDINKWIEKGRPKEKAKRGRPAKEPVEKVAKKRGRPKKEAPEEPVEKVAKKRGRPFGTTAKKKSYKMFIDGLADEERITGRTTKDIMEEYTETTGNTLNTSKQRGEFRQYLKSLFE